MGSKIVFAGSPDFAIPSLKSLIESRHRVAGVLTQPDRPAGRGRKLRPSPVKAFATEFGLDVMQPESLSDDAVQERLRSIGPDLMVIVAYGLLLPPPVLDIPRAGCVNVHASILPRWRGASPIQAAILAGDPTSGVSIMRMEKGLDTGPIYATGEISIGENETAGELQDRLAAAGARLLMDALEGILDESSVPRPQDDARATYAGRIDKTDARIDWHKAAIEIDRGIRAYHPWPAAETSLDGTRLRCWAALPDRDATGDGAPGEVIGVGRGTIDVQTGSGVLRLTEVQLAGRQRMSAGDFANGYEALGKTLGE